MSDRLLGLPFIPTASGAEYHLGKPNPGVVRIRDIAAHLSRINRWTGATMAPISVAQHSVLVAEVCEQAAGFEVALYGLLHDAAEYILGDDSRPKRAWLEQHVGFDVIARLETRVEADVFEQLGVEWPVPEVYRQLVADADDRVLATEHRDLMPDRCALFQVRPLRRTINPWPWAKAEEKFLDKYADLVAVTPYPNMLEQP